MWKLLLDDKGQPVIRNGKPVYVDPQGKEIEFDVEQVMGSVVTLREEAKTHRLAKETAEANLKVFTDSGLKPEQAKDAAKAIQTVVNLDQGKLVEAGKVEEIRSAAVKATEEKFAPVVAERDKYKTALYDEKIGGAFARSPLIVGEKAILAVPAEMVQATFGKHFTIDDATGAVVAKGFDGQPVYSKSNPGKLADFDEALGLIVDGWAHKDSILKGSGASGTGKTGDNSKSNNSGAKTKTRAEFDAMPQTDRMKFSVEGGKVVD